MIVLLLSSIFVGVVAIVLLKYCHDLLVFWRFFQNLPGEKSFHLLLGNMHLIPGPNDEGLKYDFKMISKFRTFHRVWGGPIVPVLLCYHPTVLKTILKSTAPKPRSKFMSTPYDMGFRWIGDGLLLANGQKWARNRRLLTPAFHFDILKDYVDVYNSCSKLLLNKLDTSESFDIFTPVSNCTLDVILRTAFSYESNCQVASEQNSYVNCLHRLVYLWTIRNYNPLVWNEFIYGLTSHGREYYRLCVEAHTFGDKLIEKRRATLEMDHQNDSSRSKAMDFLDILLLAKDDDGNGLSPLEIRHEVNTFLFEGHDTTASGTSWTLYSLAAHPDYQEKVYQEVVQTLGGRDQLEWADLSKLEYTTMCIKEALRAHTAVPFIERKLNEPLELDGHMIPEGTLVGVHIWNLHHNPHVWDRPHDYDPERFNAENQTKMDPFQFLPFSAGTRNCIGQNFAMNEMRVIVSSVIKNFKLVIDEKETPCKFYSVTMKTENGAKIYASRRH